MFTFFDLSFLQNLCSNTLATLVGVFVALWLDREIHAKREAKTRLDQEKNEIERKYEFLNMVWLMLDRNNMILGKIVSEGFKSTDAILLNVDAQYFEVTAAIKYEILGDISLNGMLDVVRANLRQLHDLISLQLGTGYSAKQQDEIFGFVRDREALMKEIFERIKLTRELLQETMQKVLIAIDEIRPKRISQ